jgi:hypothetical protein
MLLLLKNSIEIDFLYVSDPIITSARRSVTKPYSYNYLIHQTTNKQKWPTIFKIKLKQYHLMAKQNPRPSSKERFLN